MDAFIIGLATKVPWLVTVLSVMGALRLILKPTFSWMHQVLGAVGAKSLDESVTIVEQSTAMKWVTYILDWFASIKLAAPAVIVAPPQVVTAPAQAAAVTVTQTTTTVSANEAAVTPETK